MTALTADELARLRIPLRLLGMDPVGLWTWDESDERQLVWNYTGQFVVVAGDAWDHIQLTENFELDLADAATADRVARWLAGRVGLDVGCTAPAWHSSSGVWWLDPGFHAGRSVYFGPTEVPSLGGLILPREGQCQHSTDSRRLPDGSFYRDRLALALVCQHVGGLL